VTHLRFEVLATGVVGRVLVDRSAGDAELDRAAVDAIETWRFQPARRGPEPVSVWVSMPVRFSLVNQ
jgi:periplasmic protein TonB